MTRQETEEFFLSNLKRKMDFIILISIHPLTCLRLPPQPVGFQGHEPSRCTRQEHLYVDRKICLSSAPRLAPEHCELPWVFSAGRTANSELIWPFHCTEADVPPRCMNTVCCWLPLGHQVCRHHRQHDSWGTPEGLGSLKWGHGGGQGRPPMSQQEVKTQWVFPKCKHTEKASLQVKFIVSGALSIWQQMAVLF